MCQLKLGRILRVKSLFLGFKENAIEYLLYYISEGTRIMSDIRSKFVRQLAIITFSTGLGVILTSLYGVVIGLTLTGVTLIGIILYSRRNKLTLVKSLLFSDRTAIGNRRDYKEHLQNRSDIMVWLYLIYSKELRKIQVS